MHKITISELQEKPMDGAAPVPGWTGGPVSRTRQTVIGDGESANYSCSVVNFSKGATTGWHSHPCDQILIVTAGRGIAATEKEQCEIALGDVIVLKANERHWHGASADSTMSHITVTTVGSKPTR
jgi:quercetin dioxygenase-like cupin family protein